LTGGDTITANFMLQNSFSFRPKFKLTIVGNNAPGLSDVDSAIRRRFMILPFNHPPAQRDNDLAEKLKAEWPGILSWMIQGCLDWQANGLVRPDVVNAATECYVAEQDTFGQWLADCCKAGMGKAETTEALYQSWQRYADGLGEEPGSKLGVFPEQMEQRGFRPGKNIGSSRERGFIGICLAQEQEDFTDDLIQHVENAQCETGETGLPVYRDSAGAHAHMHTYTDSRSYGEPVSPV
jgi:putative DNA primase/helicase